MVPKKTADQAKAAAHHDDQFLQRKLLSNRRRDFSGDITSSSSSSMYASSTENISRLLEGWMRSSPKGSTNTATTTAGNKNPEVEKDFSNEIAAASVSCYCPKVEQEEILPCCRELMPHEEFEAILQFDNLNNSVLWNKSSTSDQKIAGKPRSEVPQQQQMTPASAPPLSFLEKWLLDETTNGDQVGDIIGLPSIF
ncbi:hypothetical protein SAY86_023143 [Trapa natans]|uniref:Uncharacterized protein n=1 Tax=Trapa natans TaxID=22666 RepID=A0AAN7RBA0_TRANT|nr:hypothetical protein SAY86_023143 [Trapa natans]